MCMINEFIVVGRVFLNPYFMTTTPTLITPPFSTFVQSPTRNTSRNTYAHTEHIHGPTD